MRSTHETVCRPKGETVQDGYQFGWFDWFCLWYPPGWLILFNRHWQHYHEDPQGWNGLEYALFLIPGGFYLSVLLRWLRLKCQAPEAIEQPIDPSYQTAFQQEILTPILRYYFRAELHQTEHLPRSGDLIIAMNHAGMCFPWDMVGLGVLLSQSRGWVARPLAHPVFFSHPWVRWWLPAGWSQVLGGIQAETDSFGAALQSQDSNTVVLYAPEGWRGLAKGWPRRYRLAKFDSSFVRLSDRHQVPILPVICLGNEALHPWTINIRKLARWTGLPMFPLSPLIFIFLLFPSMGVWANRTRLRYFVQPLEQPWENPDSDQALDRTTAYQKAQQLRATLQATLQSLQ